MCPGASCTVSAGPRGQTRKTWFHAERLLRGRIGRGYDSCASSPAGFLGGRPHLATIFDGFQPVLSCCSARNISSETGISSTEAMDSRSSTVRLRTLPVVLAFRMERHTQAGLTLWGKASLAKVEWSPNFSRARSVMTATTLRHNIKRIPPEGAREMLCLRGQACPGIGHAPRPYQKAVWTDNGGTEWAEGQARSHILCVTKRVRASCGAPAIPGGPRTSLMPGLRLSGHAVKQGG